MSELFWFCLGIVTSWVLVIASIFISLYLNTKDRE